MAKKGKVGKNRQDKFYHLAKEQGFRSRASFKLVQLNKRHDFLSSASRGVIDLCAAPGGWMQVARKHMPLHAPCVGIDLVPIRPVAGCIGLQGDITSDITKGKLKQALRQAGGEDRVDVVLNDGSPNMGKAWLQDAYTQSELTLAALKLASEFLYLGGTFVTKVFRSNDYNSLLFVMNQLFEKVNATKPSASRTESAEIYVMCSGFKAPKSIDSRLLNPKHVFRDMGADQDEKEAPDLFLNTVMKNMKKQKRSRGGYDDGDLTLFKRVSVLEYIRTSRPVALIVENNEISLDYRDMASDVSEEESKLVAKVLGGMPETDSEIRYCFKDLKVLSRRDFKLLLKWRSAAREVLAKMSLLEAGDEQSHKSEVTEDTEKPDEVDDGDSTDEEQLNDELKKARSERLTKEKRKRRKLSKARNAIQRKIDMKIILPTETSGPEAGQGEYLFTTMNSDGEEEGGLHSDDSGLEHPDDILQDDEEEEHSGENPIEVVYKVRRDSGVRQAEIEDELDQWYKVYVSRRKKDKNGAPLDSKEGRRITKKRALRDAIERDTANKDNDDGMDVDSDIDVQDATGKRIMEKGVAMHQQKTGHEANARETALWFSQPVFSDDSSEDEASATKGDGDNYHGKPVAEKGRTVTDDESFHSAAAMEAARIVKEDTDKRTTGDVEVVPMNNYEVHDDSSDSSVAEDSDAFHSSDYDTDEKAEMVAIGKKMRQSKRVRSDVLDEAYNRYTFDDPEDLPRWFADPDPFYRKRQAPVTKDQVAEMKEYITSLRNAPTKKEQEAKGRRKARLAKKMDAVTTKASNIAEQGEVPASSRMRAIEDLYKKAMKSGQSGKRNKKKAYQVVRPNGRMVVGKNIAKGRHGLRGTRTVLVDRRLKADKRGMAKAQRRAKK